MLLKGGAPAGIFIMKNLNPGRRIESPTCLTGLHHWSPNCILFYIHKILLKPFQRFFYCQTLIIFMSSLIARIDKIIEDQSLLKHKFYVMWNEGKLSIDSLSGYSKEYFQLVKAVPSFVDEVMKKSPSEIQSKIASNRDEEYEHIEPWIKFAVALGVSQDDLKNYGGLDDTKQAVSNLSCLMNSFEGGAAAMYALEQEIPKISLSKIDGLRKFYGMSDDDAIEYFRLHAEADIRHAALWRKILEKTPASREDELVQVAGKSLAAQNLLLDSCYNAYC